jgi:hypothetical protein
MVLNQGRGGSLCGGVSKKWQYLGSKQLLKAFLYVVEIETYPT